MFKVKYSPNLRWKIKISWSKNAALPIVAANYCINNEVKLENIPDIVDVKKLIEIAEEAIKKSDDYFDLTWNMVEKIRASILLIPFWLIKKGKVRFTSSWWCKIWKRPLDSFDKWLEKWWIKIIQNENYKEYTVFSKPKKHIMFPEFSVTATEALITYLAFADNYDYEINVHQIAIEPHVQDLINFLNSLWAKIKITLDNVITINPSKIEAKIETYKIRSDYIEAWTYFAIWAAADNSEIIIEDCDVDDLSSVYSVAEQIWINFEILDKNTIKVNSYNKKNYTAPFKFQTRIHPWFPTDLQSIWWTLFTQCEGTTEIFETIYEWRFTYLAELENLWAKVEILNPHQALIKWKTELKGEYVSTTDLRWWWAMLLAWIIASWETHITNEEIILRWYSDIINKLKSIWVNIEIK